MTPQDNTQNAQEQLYTGKHFTAEVSTRDGKFRLVTSDDNEILEVRQGSVFNSFGYGYAMNAVDELIKELEEIKERLL